MNAGVLRAPHRQGRAVVPIRHFERRGHERQVPPVVSSPSRTRRAGPKVVKMFLRHCLLRPRARRRRDRDPGATGDRRRRRYVRPSSNRILIGREGHGVDLPADDLAQAGSSLHSAGKSPCRSRLECRWCEPACPRTRQPRASVARGLAGMIEAPVRCS